MALGRASQQLDLLDPISRFCGEALSPNSIFAFMHEHRDRLFPDGMFADLFAQVGRRSVPPSVVAVVMVLQRLEGLSDREAVDRLLTCTPTTSTSKPRSSRPTHRPASSPRPRSPSTSAPPP